MRSRFLVAAVLAAVVLAVPSPAAAAPSDPNPGQTADWWERIGDALATHLQAWTDEHDPDTTARPAARPSAPARTSAPQRPTPRTTPRAEPTTTPRSTTTPTTPTTSNPPPEDTAAACPAPGQWTETFTDDFDGATLDTSKWAPNWYGEGGKMNEVGTFARNVSVADGELRLQLESATEGALVHTDIDGGYRLPVGGCAQARIFVPGPSDTELSNWAAWWASATAADGWPSSGEHDIFEVLAGEATVNYHSPSGPHNQGGVSDFPAGNSFHTYTLHRKADTADVYWDGELVKSYDTDDSGEPEILILNVGQGSNDAFGPDGAMRVDSVTAWEPQG